MAMNQGYRQLLDKKRREALIREFGAPVFGAKFAGKCGCGATDRPQPYSFSKGPCRIARGDEAVMFRGSMWSVSCARAFLRDAGRGAFEKLLARGVRQLDAALDKAYDAWEPTRVEGESLPDALAEDMERLSRLQRYLEKRDARRKARLVEESKKLNAERRK